jgi:hypothetical protein
MPIVDHIATLATAPTGATAPDSITVDNGFVWVAYTNGADSTGKSGHSTVVEYDQSGSVVQSYNIAGYVDGLKLNPVTGDIWALQNQDGNPKLAIIDPVLHKVTELSYQHSLATRGYDDVVFENGKVFLSYTNPPGTTGNAVIVELTNGNSPSGPLKTTTVLTNGIMGYNTETGTMQSVPLTDPDSLKAAPNGDLLLTNGDGGVIVDVQDPGGPNQAIAFTQVKGVTPGSAGLDDVIKPSANSGTFYLSDTKDNRVLAFHVTGLDLNDYYASVGSLNAFGQIDPTTGIFTALVNAADAPGFSFGSPHGVAFVPDAGHGPLIDHIATLGAAPVRTKSPDSITVDNGFVWAAYTNGADSTGKFGHSTIVEYDRSGSVVQSYNIAGYVDGLKLNPGTGDIWALQNQDGNSKLAIIDPVTHKVAEFGYQHTSASRGYDDVAFENGKVFLSYTNPPGTSGDAVIVELTNGNSPSGPLKTTTVLTNGIMGYNTETGTMQSVPLTDPDSLKVAPNGDLLLTSGADGVIVDVQDPGGPNQAVAFTEVKGVTPGNAGLDDVIKPSSGAGTFYLADTKDNRVLAFHVTGLNINDYYASVGSLGAFGQIDPTTGAFTALVNAADAPGFVFGSPHGVSFVPDGGGSPSVALLANYMAMPMASAASGQGGPVVTALQFAAGDQPSLSQPHH